MKKSRPNLLSFKKRPPRKRLKKIVSRRNNRTKRPQRKLKNSD